MEDLLINPDGPLVKADGSVYGSQRLIINSNPDELTALITQEVDVETNEHHFSAANSANSNGFIGSSDAVYLWDFGDGNSAQGMNVTHHYSTPGSYDVTLTILHTDGTSDAASSKAIAADPSLVDITFNSNGVEDNSTYNSVIDEIGTPQYVSIENGDYALRMKQGDSVEVTRENAQLFNLDQFTIEMSLRSSTVGNTGFLLSIHNALSLQITDEGRLSLSMTNHLGQTSMGLSQMTTINDGEWHNLAVTYNSHASELVFYLDGDNIGNATLTGMTQPEEFWGLILGHHYNNGFEGDIATFEFRDDTLSAAQVNELYDEFHSSILMGVTPADDSAYAAIIDGTTFSDMMSGTIGSDLINGHEGNDNIRAKYGDDTIYGGDGYDRLYGETGHDTLHGGDLNDRLFGDAGDDLLFGDNGYDLMYGGTGHDTMYGGLLNDRMYGEGGNDTLFGGDGNDRLFGEDGSDILNGGGSRDHLFGGGGADQFIYDEQSVDGSFDFIFDFNGGEGDVIDIADVLDFSSAEGDIISDFVTITNHSTFSQIRIDQDGAENGSNYTTLTRVYDAPDLDLATIINNGSLIVE